MHTADSRDSKYNTSAPPYCLAVNQTGHCIQLKWLEVPTTYAIMGEMFDRRQGLSIAEFEFPAYFNWFVKRKQIRLLTMEKDKEAIVAAFQETLMGPREGDYDVSDDHANECPVHAATVVLIAAQSSSSCRLATC